MAQGIGSIVIGYLLGGLNPALVIATLKKANLREMGTGNLGATNVTMSVGKSYGVFVMVLDILKAFFAAKLAAWIFPQLPRAGLLAGCGAVYGHVFPVYLKFRGGKGLAAFGGMILELDPLLFVLLLGIGFLAVFFTGHAVAMTFAAALAAPVFAGFRLHSFAVFCIVLVASLLLLYKHRENLEKIKTGKEQSLRDYFRDKKAQKREP